MKTSITAFIIGVAFTAAALLTWQRVGQRATVDPEARIAVLERENAALREELAKLAKLKGELDTAQAETSSLENRLEHAEGMLKVMEPAQPTAAPQTASVPTEATPTDIPNEPKRKNILREQMMLVLGDETMRKVQAEQMVDMGYGDFLDQFDEEKRAAIREILVNTRLSGLEAQYAIYKNGGDPTAEQLDTIKADLDARTLAELETALAPEELDAYQDYTEDIDAHMMSGSIDMQLGMYAGGMTPENRALAREVVVEELLAVQEVRRQAAAQTPNSQTTPDDQIAAMNEQLEAYRAAQERLAPHLPEAEMAQFNRFVERMTIQIEQVVNMMQ